MNANRREQFRAYREQHRVFNYSACHLETTGGRLEVSFDFDIDGTIHFRPRLSFPEPADGWKTDPTGPLAQRLAFSIGMVEVASYWKTYCPPQMLVSAGSLCDEQIAWWRKLYYLGLGEFFYTNGIAPDRETFVRIAAPDNTRPTLASLPRTGRNLIPVGGGKDSSVTLELLGPVQSRSEVLLMSAPRAARDCAAVAGYTAGEIIDVRRTLDPRLLEANRAGALNGHTPFSALLAFVSVFAAALTGTQYVVLSNESSANESTVHGSEVNHQYSKSFTFEQDFRRYVRDYLTPDIEYFSLLRPLNELQITRLMSDHPAYFPVFRSCNRGSRQGIWCGHCPKCLFAFVMLQPFCSLPTMMGIFGHDLLDDLSLQGDLDELLGFAAAKPFECVGTVEEVRAAVSLVAAAVKVGNPPRRLLEWMRTERAAALVPPASALALLQEWNPAHCLPPAFEEILKASSLFAS